MPPPQLSGTRISPEYFHAAGTALLSGRSFTLAGRQGCAARGHSEPGVCAEDFRLRHKRNGQLITSRQTERAFKWWVSRKTESIISLTEDPQPAMFLPFLQSPSNWTTLVVRSERDPQQLAAPCGAQCGSWMQGCLLTSKRGTRRWTAVLFAPHVATVSLGVLGVMGAMLSITGIFGMAAYSVSKRLRELGIRMALGAQRREVLQAALGRPLKLLAFGSAAGLALGLLATRVLAYIVYQATPRDPLVMAGVVLAMLLLGLLATWIPAQRALSVDPMVLLRDD